MRCPHATALEYALDAWWVTANEMIYKMQDNESFVQQNQRAQNPKCQ